MGRVPTAVRDRSRAQQLAPQETVTSLHSDLLHGVPKRATYKENLEALKDRFGDQHLGAAYRNQLITRTQRARESVQ
jgi:hypothetical protein